MKYLMIGLVIAIVLSIIFACVSKKDTDAFITSVDAFIEEVER